MKESLVPSSPAPSLRTWRIKPVIHRRDSLGRVTRLKEAQKSQKPSAEFCAFLWLVLPPVFSECVLEHAELWFAEGPNGHGHNVETVRGVVEAVSRNVMVGGANDALSFPMANRVFWRFGILAGFHLDEDEDGAVPCDDIHFPEFGSISRSHDAVAARAEVINGEDFRSAAEWEKAVKEEGEWHSELY